MKRINKAAARKLWNNGENFIIAPCKCSPRGLGALYIETDLTVEQRNEVDFDKFVNSFEFYNCNSEMGKYSAFYKEGE